MSRFFNPDNPIMEFIAKIFDLILLNLILPSVVFLLSPSVHPPAHFPM